MPPTNGHSDASDAILEAVLQQVENTRGQTKHIARLADAVVELSVEKRQATAATETTHATLKETNYALHRLAGTASHPGEIEGHVAQYMIPVRDGIDQMERTAMRSAAIAARLHRREERTLRELAADVAVIRDNVKDTQRAAEGKDGNLTSFAKLLLGPNPGNARIALVILFLVVASFASGGGFGSWFHSKVSGDTTKESIQIERHTPHQLPPHNE